MEELEKPGYELGTPNSGHGGAQQLCIAAVQLKIVGESLGILQDFGKQLELNSCAEEKRCRVTFRDGTYTHIKLHRARISSQRNYNSGVIY